MSRFFVHPDIAKAETINTDFYTSEAVLAEAREKIFAKSFQFICDAGLLAAAQSVVPFTLLPAYVDEPLLITRDEHGEVHCISNVCTHRGNILINEPCQANQLVCKYHGRRFRLSGEFSFMPEFKEVENFPSERDNLKSLPVFHWGPWLFTSLFRQADSVKYFGEMMQRIAWLPLHEFQFRPDMSRDYTVEAHWALYCENYLEGFHIPFVHAGLNEVVDYGTYTTELFPYSNVQIGMSKPGELSFDLPPTSPDYGKNIGAYYFWVFPNLMFNFYPWGLSLNIVIPMGVSLSKVSFMTWVWDDTKLEQGAGSDLNRVEMEDESIVEAVQKGIRSRFYTHGRYSVSREKGTHHFHRLISECMG